MTATRLEPARKEAWPKPDFLCSRAGQEPRKQEYARQIPQGPKCGSWLPSCQNFTLKLCQKQDSEKRQTDTLKTLQNGIPQQPNLAYEFPSGLSQQQDLPNGISPTACRRKRPCMLEFPNSLPESWILKIGIHQSLHKKTQNRLSKSGSGVSGFRVSNLTITILNLQDLESVEPLNPLTPDPDFGNLFCVSRKLLVTSNLHFLFGQAIGEFREGGSPELFIARKLWEDCTQAGKWFLLPGFRCKYSFLLEIALPRKTFRRRCYKTKEAF